MKESEGARPHIHDDPELDLLENQTEEELLAEVRAARKEGSLRTGGLPIQRTSPAELNAQLEIGRAKT